MAQLEVQSVNYKLFADYLNQTFRVVTDDENVVELELIEAELLPARSAEVTKRSPFSLIFRSSQQILGQGTYTFKHDTLGSFTLFIVPISADHEGSCYEAVFN